MLLTQYPVEEKVSNHLCVGHPPTYIEAEKKVQGKAITPTILSQEDALFLLFFCAAHITCPDRLIDTSKAEALEGVKASYHREVTSRNVWRSTYFGR